jgi:RNA polymerase sigma factor (sigma-70 family)
VDVEEILRAQLDPMLRFARALIGDRGAAEDAVQDVVERVLRRPAVLDGARDPQAYLRRMIVNQYVSTGRRWWRLRPTAEPFGAEAFVDDPAGVVADRDRLRSALAPLPAKQRAVLVMRYYLRLDDAEIAESLQCSAVTVRTYASRGLAAVREAWVEDFEGTNHEPTR